EGVVGTHQDVVGAIETNELLQLVRREHHRVEIQPLQICCGRMRQVAVGGGARTPGMVDAPRGAGKIASPKDREDFQVRMGVEHAVEDEVAERNRGLQRVSDYVVEVEA